MWAMQGGEACLILPQDHFYNVYHCPPLLFLEGSINKNIYKSMQKQIKILGGNLRGLFIVMN